MTNEEFEKELKRIEQVVTELRNKLLESKVDKKPCEVEVPKDIKDYYYVDELGDINLVGDTFHETDYEGLYQRGLAFKTREEAEQFDKERILINKFKDWTKKYNEGWTPNWRDFDEYKYSVSCDCDEYKLFVKSCWYENAFSKLPYFKSEEIAEQFIEEFEKEIKEVLY